ncbi:helix-turn-helix domain-containing protein [uncultured Bacteroides sp.]|uniref:helix-turn-helix domain-containing protein n=1 Tax=uncultured Bacteroides sp. TaxID=162156 RepID=UPI002AAC0196|nr:helix-turn-helix domain-containing protein [uncultured Bacteroides sp.]
MKKILFLLFILNSMQGYAQPETLADERLFSYSAAGVLLLITLLGTVFFLIRRISILKKEQQNAKETFQSLIDTAHNMLTPISLIKAPLEEISIKEVLTREGSNNLKAAIRHINTLLKLTNTFIQTEEEEKISILSYSSDQYEEVTALTAEQETTSEFKILIIESDKELLTELKEVLSEQYKVLTSEYGKKAQEIVREQKPDLVISDMILNDIGGDELCTTLKNDIETSHIPVVLLIALNDKQGILRGLKTGADEYIIKPFNMDILKATLSNRLANQALLRKQYANVELSNPNECINCSTDIDWRFIDSVKRHVEEHMADSSFNVDVLCTLLNMSRTSFYNKIKALTDQAPADYARLIRLKHAANLLKEQQHTITEIAEITGFSDAKYFREVFKKHFKVSPSKYAKGEIQEGA